MHADLTRTCPVHPERADCPDALIAFDGHSYGLHIHDGGNSHVGIAFCPWCGAGLPVPAPPDDDD